ncbi:hypothetical protein N825_14535 [Skermanella stibiiresistens SB22]|uniref:Uncharacterized protein n=1 Tax=Skermanella stibiiresistens SB22 TaxID=1385369 RepID=W9H0B7_9PROT|nr:hypothetical protein [Skermanella stibiiresistens]EWY38132.1 hypothetical protein N825_14535 [Skermanella stibiiresistens SB22]
MQGLDQFDEEDVNGTVFRDVITLALCGFVAVVILLLPHLNPKQEAQAATSTVPGNIMVEARWADELDSDIDLWVQAPGDVPVGYSNKSGVIFNLLRDDLGRNADPTQLNYEVSYSRGIPPGEYAINLHMYRNKSRVSPVKVTVVTSVKKPNSESAKQILTSSVDLMAENQELTVYRFKLTEAGDLVPSSVNSLPKSLRKWRQ